MPIVPRTTYLDRLCEARDDSGLVWIFAILDGSRHFASDDPRYGLPDASFEIVERLVWFAQGIRSGAWTYFASTLIDADNHRRLVIGLVPTDRLRVVAQPGGITSIWIPL